MKIEVEPDVIEVTLKVACNGFSLLRWILFYRRLLVYVMLTFNGRLIGSWVYMWYDLDHHGIPFCQRSFNPQHSVVTVASAWSIGTCWNIVIIFGIQFIASPGKFTR